MIMKHIPVALLCLLVVFQLSHAEVPVGKTIVLRSASLHTCLGVESEQPGMHVSNASSLNPGTHFVLEDAGQGKVRLKSVSNGRYVKRTGVDVRADGQDPTDVDCHWLWVESGEDGREVQLKNTGNDMFLSFGNGNKIKVRGQTQGAVFTWASPSDGLDHALSWRVIPADPKFPTEEVILAICDVTDEHFGLPSDPAAEDCTDAFQAAIHFAAEAGGGTVFIPEGQYRVDGPLTLMNNVMLQGRWTAPTDPQYKHKLGTVIRLENDAMDPDDAVIRYAGGGLMGLTFWHPNQKPVQGVKPYPWIIKPSNDAYIHNITFLNAYRGIYMSKTSNADVKNIFGSAYDIGLSLGPNYAISRQRNQRFSSEYLRLSGLESDPTQLKAHEDATYATGTAMQAERLHGLKYVYGHHTGYRNFRDKTSKHSGGTLYGVEIFNCQIGMDYDIDTIHARSMGIGGGTRLENCGIAIQSKAGGNITISNSSIIGSTVADVMALGEAINVNIDNSRVDLNKLSLKGGEVRGVPRETPLVMVKRKVPKLMADDEGEEADESNISLDLDNAIVRNPRKLDLFNVRDPKFAGGAAGDGVQDDTAAVQAAIAAVNANGGGYVFFPGGQYRITQSLSVEKGVQLRGSSSGREFLGNPGTGSILYIDVPPVTDGEVEAPAFITMGDDSGVRGLGFFYPNQNGGGTSGDFKKYPYTLRGEGVGNYAMYVSPINPYRFVHFQGDDNLLAYSFGSGIRQLVFSEGNRNGRIEQLMTKPTNWPKSQFPFPQGIGPDQYKTNVMEAGFELLHLKDCDDFHVSTGGYHHGGFRGATIENSSGDLGRFSLEQYVTGIAILSGDKDITINDKTSTTNRHGPDGADTEKFALKLGEDFTGHVRSRGGKIKGDFQEFIKIENGSLHRIGSALAGKEITVVDVAEHGSLFLEAVAINGSLAINNTGSIKLLNCNIANIHARDAQQFRADNNIQSIFVGTRLSQKPIRDYGLILDHTGIRQTGARMPRNTGISKSQYAVTTTNGEFNFKVEDPEFFNQAPNQLVFTIGGSVSKNTALELWYYGQEGWTKALERRRGDKYILYDAAFGQQKPLEDWPDLRLVVKSGPSPSVSNFQLSTAAYGPYAPKSPTGLVARSQAGVQLNWNDNAEANVTYNLYRRARASGAFGEPLATGLKSSSYLDTAAGDRSKYWYVITAVDAAGRESGISAEASVAIKKQ